MTAKPASGSPIVSRGDLATDLRLGLEAQGQGHFQPFVPLDSAPAPPAFPVEALPDWQAEWVDAVAAATQVSNDLPAMLALGVLSLAAAPAVDLRIRSDWRRPPTLAVCAVLPSGEGKSPCFRHAMRPVDEHASAGADAIAPAIRDAEREREDLEARIARTKQKGDASELADLRDQLDRLQVPVNPRYYTTQATPEAVVALLAKHPGLAWASSEGSFWDALTRGYKGWADFDDILLALDGDRIQVDRKTQPPMLVERPALTVVTTTQPVVLEKLAKLPGEIVRRGLVPRFLFIVPRSRIGQAQGNAPAVPARITARYDVEVRRLLELRDAQAGSGGLASQEVAAEALEVCNAWYFSEVEPRLGPGCDLSHMAAFCRKLRDVVPTLAALLRLADAEGLSGEVRAATMDRAVIIGRYLLGHAQCAWGMLEVDESVRSAKRLWPFAVRGASWSKDHNAQVITRRDLFDRARNQTSLKRVADVDEPLRLLTEHGYLAAVDPVRPSGRSGRSRSPTLLLNPEALSRDPL